MEQVNRQTYFEIILSKKKNSLWTSELWLQDVDEYGTLVLNVDLLKLFNYGCVDISVQSHNCQDSFFSFHLVWF